jgi:hypothetical protein
LRLGDAGARLRPRLGTFAPSRRAWDKPMATACLRLVTFLPERPERSFPRFISCMFFSTFCDARRLYRRFPERLDFRWAMRAS